jgi:uncharacterized membrane-anchored protein YhcB (DUF1043 family)
MHFIVGIILGLVIATLGPTKCIDLAHQGLQLLQTKVNEADADSYNHVLIIDGKEYRRTK